VVRPLTTRLLGPFLFKEKFASKRHARRVCDSGSMIIRNSRVHREKLQMLCTMMISIAIGTKKTCSAQLRTPDVRLAHAKWYQSRLPNSTTAESLKWYWPLKLLSEPCRSLNASRMIVIGAGNSGTHSFAAMLQNLGLDIPHEQMGQDGTVS